MDKVKVGKWLSDSTKNAFDLLWSSSTGRTPVHLKSRNGLENDDCQMLVGARKSHPLSQQAINFLIYKGFSLCQDGCNCLQ